ncbi:LVIVD repeat-containing protein [Gracilimonas amylolytica]|uniref:hypothetical protein n=1 Tax=Gracilimonas amylolytica TaxID=1749045 RepID=UPI000CD83E0C|nr:hypothetical protein [Gracilimonas amylolytica]
MANVKKLLIVLLVASTFGACDILSNNDGNNFKVDINNDVESLNERIQLINQPVVLDSTRSKSAGSITASGSGSFTHVANVASPEVNGKKLSATSIELRANKVYISYHLNGNDYGGAVDIIDIRDEDNPSLVSHISFADTDVNALDVEENNKLLWITGGRDVNSSGHSTADHNGAIIGELGIDKGEFEENDYRETPLPSYSGNDIVDAPGQYLYVAAGATGGGYYELSKNDFQVTNRVDNTFAKSIDRRQDDIVGLNLTADHKANFTIMDFKKETVTNFQTPFTVAPTDGKNVLEHTASITYAALGDQGVKGYKFNTGTDPVYEFNPQGDDVSNGVTVDGQYVYIANGTDGLFITTIARSGNKEPEEVYSWKGGTGSANFVKTDGNFIILANGIDGLNILRKSKK